MLYQAYQTQDDLIAPLRAMARASQAAITAMNGYFPLPSSRLLASLEMITRMEITHVRPSYAIPSVKVGNRDVEVTEETALTLPFGTLTRFRKDVDATQPKVLVVAPLSGHFATLLRGTVRTLLADHDVYITDWHNARDLPLELGPFGFEDYVDHVIKFLEFMGPGSHLVAVCQPCVQALIAAAVMAEDNNPAQPRSMTLMAGPVDTRINPTEVNRLATGKSMEWFERNMIHTVPARFPGAGRKVYPGVLQLTAFMAMNPARHEKAHRDLYQHLARGETEKAEAIKSFYDEYFAVLDLAAEFYLETIRIVFQDADLPRRVLTHRGRLVDCSKIRKTALLTVEGERDDICSLGQTAAAHDLCSGLKPFMKRHHMQAGVGHYGVFSGRRWEAQVYPIVRNMILSMN